MTRGCGLLPIYYALAAFDLLMVGGSLYLHHRIMNLYTASSAENVEWAARLDGYAELGQWAAAANAPGNDVFDSLLGAIRALGLAPKRSDQPGPA